MRIFTSDFARDYANTMKKYKKYASKDVDVEQELLEYILCEFVDNVHNVVILKTLYGDEYVLKSRGVKLTLMNCEEYIEVVASRLFSSVAMYIEPDNELYEHYITFIEHMERKDGIMEMEEIISGKMELLKHFKE